MTAATPRAQTRAYLILVGVIAGTTYDHHVRRVVGAAPSVWLVPTLRLQARTEGSRGEPPSGGGSGRG